MNTNNQKYKYLKASDEIRHPASIPAEMDPASLKAVKELQEVSKDPTLDHGTKQKLVLESHFS